QVTKRELLDPRAVGSSQLGNRVAVPGAHAADQIAFGCLLTHLWPPSRNKHQMPSGYSTTSQPSSKRPSSDWTVTYMESPRVVDLGSRTVRPNTAANCRMTAASTSSILAGCPRSFAMEVTPLSLMPHGTMRLKWSRLVFTFSANPWLVTQRAIRTPIAAI